MDQNWRQIGRSLQKIHAPLGHAAPFAASVLFACAGLSKSAFLRVLAYGLSSVLALLIGADLVQSIVDKSPADSYQYGYQARESPLAWLRILLTGLAAGLYSFLIFVGLGPWTPFYFLILVFVVAWIVASRNVNLWYRQSLSYEARLREAEELEKRHLAYKRWLEQYPPEDPSQRM